MIREKTNPLINKNSHSIKLKFSTISIDIPLIIYIVIPAIVLLAMIGIIAYFYLQDQQNNVPVELELNLVTHEKRPIPTVKEILPTHIPTITEPQIVSTNWVTYSNSDMGFSIQYPEGLYTLKLEKYFVSIEPTESFANKDSQTLTYSVGIAVTPNSENYSLSNPKQMFGNGPLLSYLPDMLRDTPINEITLDGIKAYRVDGCCGGVYGIRSDIQTIKDGNIYQIVVHPYGFRNDYTTHNNIYEKIISSFKFIN